MDVGSVSMVNDIASLATALKSQNMAEGANMAVLRQIMQTQQMEADMLIKMMESAPRWDGTGQVINTSA